MALRQLARRAINHGLPVLSLPARPDAALAFLRSRGLTRAQVRAIIVMKFH